MVTDPKGTILVECGKMLQRGAPKLGKDGKPMKDKHHTFKECVIAHWSSVFARRI